jgi:hypothetical protein
VACARACVTELLLITEGRAESNPHGDQPINQTRWRIHDAYQTHCLIRRDGDSSNIAEAVVASKRGTAGRGGTSGGIGNNKNKGSLFSLAYRLLGSIPRRKKKKKNPVRRWFGRERRVRLLRISARFYRLRPRFFMFWGPTTARFYCFQRV